MTAELEADLAALADRLRLSSVSVHSERGAGSGSGVVWTADGTIVTNAHVAVTPTVIVEFTGGRRVRGVVDRRDEERDLARIRTEVPANDPCVSRDPHDLRVGEFVAAFGNPLGVRDVLSTGIVFAAHRAGRDRFVQADVAIAPGHSGGALADAGGRVVGIITMVAGGLALAIPAGDVRRFLGAAIAPVRLGVRVARADLGGRMGYAIVAVEPGSTAERSGLIVGDVIVTPSLTRIAAGPSVGIIRAGRTAEIALVHARGATDAAA